ncbi:MAG: hypothetical protein P4M11_01725 [Candidatus Pacebacteria bacterium]|nr:hypothetical protein [Candidatus Paceibacterota bacterium]
MELQQLIEKANEEMLQLKEQDPAKYLEALKKLNEIIEGLNQDLKEI